MSRIELGVVKACRKRDVDPKRPGHRVCLYTKSKPRRLLGRHKTLKSALRQERFIQMKKHSVG